MMSWLYIRLPSLCFLGVLVSDGGKRDSVKVYKWLGEGYIKFPSILCGWGCVCILNLENFKIRLPSLLTW